MDIFDNLTIIVSGSHLEMLNTLLTIAQFLFTVFTGIMLGSLMLSTSFKRQSFKKSNESNYQSRMSLEMMDLITSSPTTWFGFGLVPFLAIIVIYIQLTAGAGTTAPGVLLFGFLFYSFGLLLAYFYKNSNRFIEFYDFVKSNADMPKEDYRTSSAEQYNNQMTSIKSNTGFWAVFMMIFGLWAFVTGTHIASDPTLWSDATIVSFFTLAVFYKMVSLLAASFAVAAATFLYLKFHWDGGFDFKDEGYKAWAKNKSATIAASCVSVYIIFYGLSLSVIPEASNSAYVYGGAALAIVFAFIATNLFYTIIKTKKSSYIRFAFPLVIAMFLFMVCSNQNAFEVSNTDNVARIAGEHKVKMASLYSEVEVVEIDGEEIYKIRCAACHKFDEKQVMAPSYKDVLPKYDSDTQALIDYILNPSAVDTENYPSGMANPALKGPEAKAVAEYLQEEMKKYN